MKKYTIAIFLLGIFTTAFGQQYYPEYHYYGDVYGGNNTRLIEEPEDDAGSKDGWNVVLDSATSNKYSKAIKIPFAFFFNGVQVQYFKVSSTGFITFDTTVNGTPSDAAEMLPSSKLPDKTISVWGLNGKGSNDQVLTKVKGNSPLQMWVKFSSYSSNGDTTGAWNYMAVVFEQISNRIYIVSMYHNNANGNYTPAIIYSGIQLNSTTAINTPIWIKNQYPKTNQNSDNKYIEFNYGAQKNFDIKAASFTASDWVAATGDISYMFKYSSIGKDSVDSLNLCIRINGGTVKKSLMVYKNPRIAPNGYNGLGLGSFIKSAAAAGDFNELEAWVESATGLVDEDHSNDTLKLKVLSVSGAGAKRKMLIEASTATWCGTCPPVNFRLGELKSRFGDTLVIVKHHSDDRMAGNGDSLVRKYFRNVGNLAINREIIKENILAITTPAALTEAEVSYLIKRDDYSPVDIAVSNVKLDTLTRKFSFKVGLKFTDYCPGNIRIGGIAVEDAVRGIGTGWDQALASSVIADIKSPFYGQANPLKGYYHDQVAWNISGDVNGRKVNHNGIFNPGDTISYTFSYTYPALLAKTTITSSPYYPIGGIYSYGKPADMKAVGFVALDNGNEEKFLMLNAAEQKLWDATANAKNHTKNNITIYPNPSNGELNVAIKPGNYSVKLFNVSGAEMWSENTSSNGVLQLNPTVAAGIYFVQITATNGEVFHSTIIRQ